MAIPEGFNLRKLFGQYFDMIRRTGSEHAEDIIELVEQRRAMKRCDVCGLPMQQAANQPKPYIGSYLCSACCREFQGR